MTPHAYPAILSVTSLYSFHRLCTPLVLSGGVFYAYNPWVGIRASSLPFGETAIHVLVIREATVLPRSTGSAERQRLADALSLRADARGALRDSPSFAERRAVIDGSRTGVELGGFVDGATYLVTVIASNADDLDEEPFIASGSITLESGQNSIRLELRRNNAAMLTFFVNNYAIDPWSAEFAGLQLAVMDTGNNRALLLTGFRDTGWNEIAPVYDDRSLADFTPRQIVLADRGRLLLYGELSGQGDANGPGFFVTNTRGRILEWFGTGLIDDSIAGPVQVDRVRGYAYFVDPQNGLTQMNLANGETDAFVGAGLPPVGAFTVNSNGILFIYTDDGEDPPLIRYNPLRGIGPDRIAVDDALDLGAGFTPTDMTFAGTILLMFDPTAVDPQHVVVGLDSNYTIRGSFGSLYSNGQEIGDREFYSPIRFLADNSRNVFAADGSDGQAGTTSRIVRFRGATGMEWFTYGSYGGQTGEFAFFVEEVMPQ